MLKATPLDPFRQKAGFHSSDILPQTSNIFGAGPINNNERFGFLWRLKNSATALFDGVVTNYMFPKIIKSFTNNDLYDIIIDNPRPVNMTFTSGP